MIIFGSFLMLLASAGRKDVNDHIFGINGCEATPMARTQIDDPVSEFFYSFQIDNIPRFEHNKEEGTVKLPMGELLQGWYYHTASVFDLLDAGVVEWFFFPNPSSLFTHANWGTAENLMTVMNEGTLDEARKRDEKRMRDLTPPDDDYVWENADRTRRFKVNTHAAMTSAQKQFAGLSFDQKQTDQVIANPEPVPDFVPLQDALTNALKDVDFPLSPGDHEDLKVSTNCLHGESPDYNDEYLVIELNKERVYHKGQTLFPLKLWTNVAGRSYWKINEEKRTLELYFRGFQMGYLNAQKPEKELKYFQSPPHMRKDNRVNEDAPKFGNPQRQQPFCNLPSKIRKMEEDVHMFWQPVDVVCPPEKLAKFEEMILEADFTTLVETSNLKKETKLITAATDYVMCGNNYLRSFIKYSHGYDFLEAGAFIHFLLEFHAPFVVPFLTHQDLNQFKVDYIYGKEAPPVAVLPQVAVSMPPASDTPKDTVMMVAADQGSYIVNGFAFVGLVTLVYGAYAHYFGKKAGDNTQLQMA